MVNAARTLLVLVPLTAVLGLSACGGSDDDASAPPTSASQPASLSAAPVAPSPAVTGADTLVEDAPQSFVMPDFVGMDLQDAQDRVQAELDTFFSRSHDLLEDRFQVLDRNWQVCDQTPAAGTPVTVDGGSLEGEIDFGVVKDEETCP